MKSVLLQRCAVAMIVASIGFIIYCYADWWLPLVDSQQAASVAPSSADATAKATPATANTVAPAVYADLEKRLQELRKQK